VCDAAVAAYQSTRDALLQMLQRINQLVMLCCYSIAAFAAYQSTRDALLQMLQRINQLVMLCCYSIAAYQSIRDARSPQPPFLITRGRKKQNVHLLKIDVSFC
jgi:hypothetical protein